LETIINETMKSFILAVALLLSINAFSQDTATIREATNVVKIFDGAIVAQESSSVKFYFVNADSTGHMRCDARLGDKLTRFYADTLTTLNLGTDTTVQLIGGRFYFNTLTERTGQMAAVFVNDHLTAIYFIMGKLTLVYIIKPNPIAISNAL
jgi:hypothetical protein